MLPQLFVQTTFDYKLVAVWSGDAERVVNDIVTFNAPTAIITMPDSNALSFQQKRHVIEGLHLVWQAGRWSTKCQRLPMGLEFQTGLGELVSGLDSLTNSVDPARRVKVKMVTQVADTHAWIIHMHAWI